MKKQMKFCDAAWGFLQHAAALIGSCGQSGEREWTREKKNRVRTSLFFFFFVYMAFVYSQGLYQGKEYFKYHSLVFFFVLLGVAWVSREKPIRPVKWNSAVARFYLLFWMWVCVSDFVVSKRFRHVGYSMLFAMPVIFLVWQQMKHKEDMVKSFCRAFELFFVAGAVYNVCCSGQEVRLPYCGYMKNAEAFGICSAFACLVFAVELYECFRESRFGGAFLFWMCGFSCALLQVFLSGTWITAWYACVLCILVFVGAFRSYGRLPAADRVKIAACTMTAILAAGLYVLALRQVSWDFSDLAVRQLPGSKDLGRRFRVAERNLGELNWFGHASLNLKIGKAQKNPQNNLLQIGYRYGAPAAFLYLLLFGAAAKKAVHTFWRMRKNWDREDLLAAGVFVLWWTVGMFANTEYPYCQPVWIFSYLMIGRYMVQ